MSAPLLVLGPPTGSSALSIWKSDHDRLIIDVKTDFGEARGVFALDSIDTIVSALIEIRETK